MTREQEKALAVALDGLREAGLDAADVVRAVLPELIDDVEGILERGEVMCLLSDRTRCYDAKCCREGRLRTMLGHVCEYPHPTGARCAACGNSSKSSTPETSAGASTPRPAEETEQRGGLTVRRGAPVCSHCRDTAARVDCRACGGSGLASLDDVRPDVV